MMELSVVKATDATARRYRSNLPTSSAAKCWLSAALPISRADPTLSKATANSAAIQVRGDRVSREGRNRDHPTPAEEGSELGADRCRRGRLDAREVGSHPGIEDLVKPGLADLDPQSLVQLVDPSERVGNRLHS